jgi:hypothetical protein
LLEWFFFKLICIGNEQDQIVEPKDLIQIIGKFCLDEERILPQKETKSKLGLKPHTAQKTFQLNSYGSPKD